MSEHAEGAREDAGPASPPGGVAPDRTRPSLTSQVRRRRADQAFFLRLRDAIQQNHRALERLGT
ncbi:MAG: hypothetical protein ABSH29_12555 [Acidimicrobiales bacterium]